MSDERISVDFETHWVNWDGKADSKVVEFSRNFGQNADIYRGYVPRDTETGDLGYDCE